MKLSLSKFYSLCPKNFKKAEERTEYCNIRAAGEKMAKKYEAARRNQNSSLQQISRLRSTVYESQLHKKLLPQIFPSKKFKLNYFMENHGRKQKHLKIYLEKVGYITSRYTEKMQSVVLGSEPRQLWLMACPLSLPDPSKYFNIDFRIKVKRGIRTNKYAPDRTNPLESDTEIMRFRSSNTQRTRVKILRGIGVSLSI
ncbi:hypothetical protein BB560_000481 [Smittium megazygosporum]|uniref:Uncharacterized protein n=1 Tax=Smittium megazygosporum TaxID=133381 RepID=A0A2T9ZKC4_9FUNG|nr:hypothetical protein BB560_000481 [Smittium megazygosporum]